MFKTIGNKVIASMAFITVGILVLTISFIVNYSKVLEKTTLVSQTDIPIAILSTSMLDEIDDMYANVLGYMMGSAESQDEFEKNRTEFNQFMAKLKVAAAASNIEAVEEIESLFNEYHVQVRKDVFSRYDPEEEAWARQRVSALISFTGRDLEALLDKLKQSEIDDSRQSLVLTKISHEDDLAGVRFYLELVDEAGDMVANLSQYIDGDENANSYFISDSQNFEQYLSQLKPYEKKESEVNALKKVSSLFKVLRDGGFEVIRRYNPALKKKAIESIETTNSQLFYRLETLLDKMSLDSSNTANASLASMRHDIGSSLYYLSFLLFFVFIVCLILTYLSYRTVLRPLSELSALLKNLSEGNVNIDLVHTNRKDEIGEIAIAIEVFKNSLIARNKVEKELVKEKENAVQATLAKADFLASMSHEIRTPMNGIIGLIELLMNSSLNSNQMNMANTIQDSANSLLNIINDILDFSKIEAGKLEINLIPFNLIKTTECVLDTLRVCAENKNVKLELFTDPNIPESLFSDSIRIRQILFNLIGNAIKFSTNDNKQGVVRIELNLVANKLGVADIEIVVNDNGIGINDDELGRLFTPFVQAESTISRRFGGTGLGLSICQTIVDHLGGKITVTSQIGIGSCFKVNLFIKVISPASLYTSSIPIIIFHLIDSDWLRFCIEKYLTANNIEHRAVLSSDLMQQMSLLNSEILVIRITDNRSLPRLDIDKLDESINSKEHLLKYIVFDEKEKQEQYIEEDTFLIPTSPCLKPTTLIHAIKVVIGDEKPIDFGFDTGVKCHLPPILENVILEDEPLILVVEDNKTNRLVICRQLDSLGYNCILANNGSDAELIYTSHSFDLVLTDCHMPKMDGYQLTKRLREIQREINHYIPIIAISADVVVGTDKKCIEAGMDDYISKPIKLFDLQTKLIKWLSPLHVYNLQDYQQISNGAELNNAVLYEVYDGNIEHYIAGLNDFLEHCFPDIYSLGEFKEPGMDYEHLEQLSHKLKSSSKMVGAIVLPLYLEKLEHACKIKDNYCIESILNEITNLSASLENTIKKNIEDFSGRLAANE